MTRRRKTRSNVAKGDESISSKIRVPLPPPWQGGEAHKHAHRTPAVGSPPPTAPPVGVGMGWHHEPARHQKEAS